MIAFRLLNLFLQSVEAALHWCSWTINKGILTQEAVAAAMETAARPTKMQLAPAVADLLRRLTEADDG